MINAEQLQRLLREFQGPLAGVEVKHKSEADALFRPEFVDVTGVAHIHGKPVVYEVEDLDLRRFKSTDDIIGFAGQLLESFKSADQAPQFKAIETH